MQILNQKWILVVAGVVVVFGLLSVMKFSKPNREIGNGPGEGEPVACPMDARLCPDGSSVGRSGPRCEFDLCPGTGVGPGSGSEFPETEVSTGVALNRQFVKDGIIVLPFEVISDSRCPMNARCIWAGEVELKVGLSKGREVTPVNLKLGGDPVSFDGKMISLVSVTPEKTTAKEISSSDYRFVFEIAP